MLQSITNRKIILQAFLCAAITLAAILNGTAFAGAPYCALRDPSHQIYEMFPNATNYRSVVREIDSQTRQQVNNEVPFRLLGQELGQHTIYVPLAGEQPLGFVHVRSEMSDWGLIEIAWALTPQLQVDGFRYQRCRGAACTSLIEKGLEDVLQGKDQQSLSALLKNGQIDMRDSTLSSAERQLATATLKSAIKTIAVTKSAWASTVAAVSQTEAGP